MTEKMLLACMLVSMLVGCDAEEEPIEDICMNVTEINGEVPPGELAVLQDPITMMDTSDDRGDRVVVTAGTRKAGTRVGIHVHEYGGHTCVLSGTITIFMEGEEPMTYGPDTCYYMPSGTLMAAANLGSEDVRLIDTFNLPYDQPTITICEPGYPP